MRQIIDMITNDQILEFSEIGEQSETKFESMHPKSFIWFLLLTRYANVWIKDEAKYF